MKIKSILLAAYFLVIVSITVSAQKQTFWGISINSELLNNLNPRIGGGLTLEKKFNDHHGIETGVFCRSLYSGTSTTGYLSFPLQYKHYLNKYNFSLGVNVDVKSLPGTIGAQYVCGFSSKVSKSYHLSSSFILEPELRFNVMTSDFDGAIFYGGFGIIGKFDLSALDALKKP